MFRHLIACCFRISYTTNSPKPHLLLSLHSSFTPNWKHCSLANPILIHPLLPTSLPVSTPNTMHQSHLTVCLPDSLDQRRSPLAASPIPHRVQALSTNFFYHFTDLLPTTCAIAPRPGYGCDHLRTEENVYGGRRRTSAIALSRPLVFDAGTVSLLLFIWMPQWTHLKPSSKLTGSLREGLPNVVVCEAP